MPLTGAERARRYRQKLKENEEKYNNHKKKEIKRLKKHKPKVSELNEEEKEKRRKIWREQKRTQRENKKVKNTNPAVPAPTPEGQVDTNLKTKQILRYRNLYKRYQRTLKTCETYKKVISSLRKKRYRLETEYKKKIELLEKEKTTLKEDITITENSMRQVYAKCKSNKEKNIVKEIIYIKAKKANKVPHGKILGIKGKIRRNTKKRYMVKNTKTEIEAFFCRDDISRSTAGMKETKSKNKRKMQIRYLTDTIQNLHQIYKKEGGKFSITTFYRYKPFYVLSPTLRSRNTCLCIKHSNVEYMFMALKINKAISYKNMEELLSVISCDINSYTCMYNKCDKCKIISFVCDDKSELAVKWYKWERVPHQYEKSGKMFSTKKMVKQQVTGSVARLLNEFKLMLPAFKTHFFNWKEQQRQYRKCINNMTDQEIVILCDFSENYECKYTEEVQSTHFGASKNSITLHTGVVFFKNRSQSFVTISDNNCHEPNAIWAHLLPIIKLAKEQCDIETIHFFSDGPSSQYRQKKNFFLLNLFTEKLRLKSSTWNFSESGHGKSVADGIGGAVKRKLDGLVTYGRDITNGLDAYSNLKNVLKSIKCFYVCDGDIKRLAKLLNKNINPVPGTMQIHQIICDLKNLNTVLYRPLSCFCERGMCTCYQPKQHTFTPHNVQQKPEQNVTSEKSLGPEKIIPSAGLPNTEEALPESLLEKKTLISMDDVTLITDFEIVERENVVTAISPDLHSSISLQNETSMTDFEVAQYMNQNMCDGTEPNSASSPTLLCWKGLDFQLDQENIIEDCCITSPKPLSAVTIAPSQYSPIPSTSTYIHNIPNKSSTKKQTISKSKLIPIENLIPLKKIKITSRTFICQMCNIRKTFNLSEMTTCNVCKKWVCILCSGTTCKIDFTCYACNYSKF